MAAVVENVGKAVGKVVGVAGQFLFGLATDLLSGLMPKLPEIGADTSHQELKVAAAANRTRIYGETVVSGPIVKYLKVTTSGKEYNHFFTPLANHPCTSVNLYQLDGKSNTSMTGNGYRLIARLGDQTTALSTAVSEMGNVDSTFVGFGITDVYHKYEINSDIFPNGVNDVKFLVKGAKVYDPRKDSTQGGTGAHRHNDPATWEWSDNPVLISFDWKRFYGDIDLELALFDLSNIAAEASLCDELVNYTDKNGNPQTEKRYTCNGVIDLNVKPKAIEQSLLLSCAGEWIFSGGKYYIAVGAYRGPAVLTINESDLKGDVKRSASTALEERCNAVTSTFISKALYYQETDSTPVISTYYKNNRDKGRYLETPRSFNFVQTDTQVQRLNRQYMEYLAAGDTLQMAVGWVGLKCARGRTVNVNLPSINITGKEYAIIDNHYDIESQRWELTLRETAAAIYDDSVTPAETDLTPNTDIDNTVVAPVTGITFTQTEDNSWRVGYLTWAHPVPTSVVEYEITFASADGLTRYAPTRFASGPYIDVSSLGVDTYTVYIRAKNRFGKYSAEAAATFVITDVFAFSGSKWLSGTDLPAPGLGNVDDFYWRTSNGDVYKKTGPTTWSLDGNIAGGDGDIWYSGTTSPAAGLGDEDDWYLNTSNGDVYRKQGSAWVLQGNLKGPKGADGKNTFTLLNSANCTIEGNTITKTSGAAGGSWDSGAYSKEAYPACFASVVLSSPSGDKMFGLSNDDGSGFSYDTIDYGMHIANGVLYIYHHGEPAGLPGRTYNAGDVLTVVNDGTRVSYQQNGEEFYVSPITPVGLYRFDCSIVQINTGYTSVAFGPVGAGSAGTFTLRNVVNCSVSGTAIKKVSGGNAWNAAAYSLEAYPTCFASASGEMYQDRMFGLSNNPGTSASFDDMDYALYLAGAVVQVYEGGERYGPDFYYSYSVDDVFSVVNDGKVVRYMRNGETFYTSTNLPSGSYRFYAAILTQGGELTRIGFGPQGAAGADAPSFSVSASAQIFTFDKAGAAYGTTSTVISAKVANLSGAVTWTTSPANIGTNNGNGTYTITAAQFGANNAVTVTATLGQYSDSTTIHRVTAGTDAINVVLSNQTHAIPANAEGVVTTFAGSGTDVNVYEGANELAYNPGTLSAGQWQFVSAVGTNISGAGITDMGVYARVNDIANIHADNGYFTFIITGKRANGQTFTTSGIRQTFTVVRAGTQGAEGASAFTLLNTANCTISPGRVTKTSGAPDWDAGAYSAEAYPTAFVSASPGSSSIDAMFGLSNDDGSSAHYGSIDYAVYFHPSSGVRVWSGSSDKGLISATYSANDIFSVISDGITVRFYRNGVDTGITLPALANTSLRFDCSIVSIGHFFKNISFGPSGRKGDNGLSAYELWLASGNSGTMADFLVALNGDDGIDGNEWFDVASGVPSGSLGKINDFALSDGRYVYQKTGTTTWTYRQDLKGPKGDTGEAGASQRSFAAPIPNPTTLPKQSTYGTIASLTIPAGTWTILHEFDGGGGGSPTGAGTTSYIRLRNLTDNINYATDVGSGSSFAIDQAYANTLTFTGTKTIAFQGYTTTESTGAASGRGYITVTEVI